MQALGSGFQAATASVTITTTGYVVLDASTTGTIYGYTADPTTGATTGTLTAMVATPLQLKTDSSTNAGVSGFSGNNAAPNGLCYYPALTNAGFAAVRYFPPPLNTLLQETDTYVYQSSDSVFAYPDPSGTYVLATGSNLATMYSINQTGTNPCGLTQIGSAISVTNATSGTFNNSSTLAFVLVDGPANPGNLQIKSYTVSNGALTAASTSSAIIAFASTVNRELWQVSNADGTGCLFFSFIATNPLNGSGIYRVKYDANGNFSSTGTTVSGPASSFTANSITLSSTGDYLYVTNKVTNGPIRRYIVNKSTCSLGTAVNVNSGGSSSNITSMILKVGTSDYLYEGFSDASDNLKVFSIGALGVMNSSPLQSLSPVPTGKLAVGTVIY